MAASAAVPSSTRPLTNGKVLYSFSIYLKHNASYILPCIYSSMNNLKSGVFAQFAGAGAISMGLKSDFESIFDFSFGLAGFHTHIYKHVTNKKILPKFGLTHGPSCTLLSTCFIQIRETYIS